MKDGAKDIGVILAVAAAVGLALTALWAPVGWAPSSLAIGVEALGGLFLTGLTVLAMRARLDFVRAARAGQEHTTLIGSSLIGLSFVAILIALAAGILYAVGKHGLYTPFAAAPGRLEALGFFADQAIQGAVFDVFDVFGSPTAPTATYDPLQRWGFGAAVVAFRLIASFAAWSLIFAYIAQKAARPVQ